MIVLTEFFAPAKVVTNLKGKVYCNQFIASLIKTEPTYNYQGFKNANTPNLQKTKQTFSLGSEWLYFKIYCGIKSSDKILSEGITRLVDELLMDNMIEKFYFVRYTDDLFRFFNSP